MSVFCATWPITEAGLDMTQAELIAEAKTDVSARLVEARAALTGPLVWRLGDADGEPTLIAEAPARRWGDPA